MEQGHTGTFGLVNSLWEMLLQGGWQSTSATALTKGQAFHGCTEMSHVAAGVCVGGLETSAGVTDEYGGSAAGGRLPSSALGHECHKSGSGMPEFAPKHPLSCPWKLMLPVRGPSALCIQTPGPLLPRPPNLDQLILQLVERNVGQTAHTLLKSEAQHHVPIGLPFGTAEDGDAMGQRREKMSSFRMRGLLCRWSKHGMGQEESGCPRSER